MIYYVHLKAKPTHIALQFTFSLVFRSRITPSLYSCTPVSYTHLDVYKRQAYAIVYFLDMPGDKIYENDLVLSNNKKELSCFAKGACPQFCWNGEI